MEQDTKNCPYCGEEILAIAKKCKHCGEWLEERETPESDEENECELDDYETSDEEDSSDEDDNGLFGIKRIGITALFLVISWIFFELGSWNIIWRIPLTNQIQWAISEAIKQGETIGPRDQSFLLDRDGIVMRVNKRLYGFAKDTRHFDAPVIQWFMLCFAISSFGCGVYYLFTGKFYDDD